MIPGIIAWVRRKAIAVINYLWSNTSIYPSVDVNPSDSLRLSQVGGFYGIYDSYDNHGRLLVTGSNSAVYISTIVKFNTAVTADKQYMTTDFIYWKPISIGYSDVCKVLLYGNGVYVAFGAEDSYYRNHFYYSQDDGLTWNLGLIDTSSQSGLPTTFSGRPNCGIFANGKFTVFLKSDNKFLTSVNGINWTVNTFSHPAGWFDIIYRHGYYLVYAQDWDRFLVSTDGVNWSLNYSGRYVKTAIATETSVVLFTGDGSYSYSTFGPSGVSSFNRTVPLPNTTDRVYRARYGNGRIIVSLTDSESKLPQPYYKMSYDGLTWSDEVLPTHPSGPITWLNIYFTAGHFRAVGRNLILGTFTAVNFTGESESWVIIIPSIGDLNDIAIVNDKIILAGNNKLAIEVQSVSNNSVVTASIQNQINAAHGVLVHEDYDKVAYGNGIFIYLCINSRYIIASQTFQFQTGVRFNITAIGNIYQLIFSNNLFYIIGSNFVLKSSDGATWNQESLPVSDSWQFAKTGSNIILLIGQSSTLYSLDGSAWLTTTRPIPNVYACEFWDSKFILTDALSDNIYITTDAINYNQFSVNGGVGVCSGPIGFIDSTVYQGKLFATFISTTQAVIIRYSYDCQNWNAGSSRVVWRPDGSTETTLLEHTYKFFAENEGKLYAVPKQLNPASGSESWRLIEKTAIIPPVVLTMVSSGEQIFSVANTAYATVNTLDITVQVLTGQVLKFGTCNLPQASTVDDTYIKLIDPTGLELTDNDDFIDYASYIEVTAAITGDYILRIGGYSDTAASGTVAWEIYNVG